MEFISSLDSFRCVCFKWKATDVIYDGSELRIGYKEKRKDFTWSLNLHSGLKLNFKLMSLWRKTPDCTFSWDSKSQKLLVLNVIVKDGEESGLMGPLSLPFQRKLKKQMQKWTGKELKTETECWGGAKETKRQRGRKRRSKNKTKLLTRKENMQKRRCGKIRKRKTCDL